MVAFQHQYITNPTVSPESHVMAAAQQITTSFKGNLPMGNETVEALTTASTLFAKIAAAKLVAAVTKEQHNKLRTYPAARKTLESPPPSETMPLPRMGTTPTVPKPRVAASTQVDCRITPDDCCISGRIVALPPHCPCNSPNYISQDDDKDKPPAHRYPTQATTRSIMQEAMLLCIDLTQKTYTLPLQQMSCCRLPMIWPCKMANSVLGVNGKLPESSHLTANPATRKTCKHSYGNEIGRLAQGMPGRNTGMNTIHFILCTNVPRDRTKDVMYGLITVLI